MLPAGRPVDTAPPTRRRALLVFADPLSQDLSRRAWDVSPESLRLARALLAGPLPGADQPRDHAVHLFTRGALLAAETAGADACHLQRGTTFGERLANAVADLAALGFADVVVVGRDCPALTPADVDDAFAALAAGAPLVLGPDHAGGCWLIGLPTAEAPRLLAGVTWQRGRDFAALLAHGLAAGPVRVLARKHDLDSLRDLVSFAHSGEAPRAVAAWAGALLRALESAEPASWRQVLHWFDAALHALRARWQLPPP